MPSAEWFPAFSPMKSVFRRNPTGITCWSIPSIPVRKTGTAENEIISTLSIATSSLVTIVVLALGVALLVPLQPVLQSPVLQPAFANVVPALFGAMAYQYFRKNVQVAVAPLVVMSLLFMLVPSLTSSTSFMIIPSGALAIGIAYSMYRKQKKEADVK